MEGFAYVQVYNKCPEGQRMIRQMTCFEVPTPQVMW